MGLRPLAQRRRGPGRAPERLPRRDEGSEELLGTVHEWIGARRPEALGEDAHEPRAGRRPDEDRSVAKRRRRPRPRLAREALGERDREAERLDERPRLRVLRDVEKQITHEETPSWNVQDAPAPPRVSYRPSR